MRISAIQNTRSIYVKQNYNKQTLHKTGMADTITENQPQNPSFNGYKAPLAVAGAIIGGLLIGPAGLLIGAGAALKGAELAEEEEKKKAVEPNFEGAEWADDDDDDILVDEE